MVDYYKLLEISRNASFDEISQAIRKTRRLWNNRANSPDSSIRAEAEQHVREVAEAEKTLLDNAKREAYDRGAAFGGPVRTDEFIRLNYKLPSTKTTIESRHSNGNPIIDLLNRKRNVYRKDGVTYKAGVKVPSK